VAGELPVRHAIALGLLHGPAELLPISSSAHMTVVPWLLDWQRPSDPELAKAFDVTLHGASALALMLALRTEIAESLRAGGLRMARLLVIASLPPALVGFALERPIERRLGGAGTIAAGLLLGALAMIAADRCPQEREAEAATASDALWLGVGQACALIPGVSRSGASLTAARRLRFTRRSAGRLSRQIALPVIAGATGLKLERLRRRGLPPGAAAPLLAGACSSFAATAASARLVRQIESDRPLLPYAVYRLLLVCGILWRMCNGASAARGTIAR
jgi:undecaprenyl-diphosphatase